MRVISFATHSRQWNYNAFKFKSRVSKMSFMSHRLVWFVSRDRKKNGKNPAIYELCSSATFEKPDDTLSLLDETGNADT